MKYETIKAFTKEQYELHQTWLRTDGKEGQRLIIARAYLAGANLAGANLARANLAGANLADANLAGADLADAKNVPASVTAGEPQEPLVIPVVPDLERSILADFDAGRLNLEMDQWHSCSTTHCMAGSAIHKAGEAGYALEAKVGPHMAGKLIFRASTPDKHAPHFYASNEKALADLRARVAKQGESR